MTHEEEVFAKQFFKAAWQNNVENYKEKENQAARELRIYDTIRAEAEKHPELMKILTDVENASIRYLQTVDALTRVRVEKESKEIIQARDQARRLAHNACIDELNLLSRQFRAAGLDNEWRRQIGLDRENTALTEGELALLKELKNNFISAKDELSDVCARSNILAPPFTLNEICDLYS